MEKIVNWISNNPYLAAAGLLVTFLGFIWGIVATIVQRERKQLYYTFSTTQLVEEELTAIRDMEILFRGEHIDTLSVTNICIWNSGNIVIKEADDFYPKHKLKITPCGFKILSIAMLEESSDTIESYFTINNNEIDISFQTFEKGDYISFNVYHTGNNKCEFNVHGKILNGKIINKTVSIETQMYLLSELSRQPINNLLPFKLRSIWLKSLGVFSILLLLVLLLNIFVN